MKPRGRNTAESAVIRAVLFSRNSCRVRVPQEAPEHCKQQRAGHQAVFHSRSPFARLPQNLTTKTLPPPEAALSPEGAESPGRRGSEERNRRSHQYGRSLFRLSDEACRAFLTANGLPNGRRCFPYSGSDRSPVLRPDSHRTCCAMPADRKSCAAKSSIPRF
jgi:hypothetical protein